MASDRLEERWAERDRQREEAERQAAERSREHRARHVAIVEEALNTKVSGWIARRLVAEAAVDALLDAGVVFAYMNTSVEADDDR